MSFYDKEHAKKFLSYSPGDQVVFRITGTLDSIGLESVSIRVNALDVSGQANTVKEAARRAFTEKRRERDGMEPSVG